MKIDRAFLDQFPELPKAIYQSYPVYLEPIQSSGERITVLIVVTSPEVVVHKTIRKETLDAMLGSKSSSFSGLVSLCANSIELHLKGGGTFDSWTPPVSGCHKGSEINEHAHGCTDTLRLSTRIYSCMGFLPGEADFNEEPVVNKRDRWPDLIESALFDKHPEMVKNLRIDFRVSRQARPTVIDFIGHQYAANFGKIDPGQNFANGIRTVKSKLWDMEALRDSRKGMIKDSISDFEILLWRPDFDSPAYSERQISNLKEALAELEYEGDKRELRVYQAMNQETAADRIILKEAV